MFNIFNLLVCNLIRAHKNYFWLQKELFSEYEKFERKKYEIENDWVDI